MTTSQWPTHVMGLDEWNALPEGTSHRFELVEGVLSVVARPTLRHQWALAGITDAPRAALPPEYCALPELEVVIEGDPTPTVRVPDVVVQRRDAVHDRPSLRPADVLAVIEILSPGSRRLDRTVKLAEYAMAGIAHYAFVDLGPPVVLTSFTLGDERYSEGIEHRGRSVVDVGFPIELDLATLAG